MFSGLGYDDASSTGPQLQRRKSTRARPRQSRHSCRPRGRTTRGVRRLVGVLPLELCGGLSFTTGGMLLCVWVRRRPIIKRADDSDQMDWRHEYMSNDKSKYHS
ncbi:hypothetical protein L211DRAFT_52594 [Terfezia boudieri ATCC MYA-4762]|uniref:Uncharacterized protein n=1 Tax=Terfezia boudieri ATCC MYA-4762 TaxID=1051890 RepID=A0A3N4M4N0_9PEZI|nr:hypothetical protein L211DRAFT_52594 [Terfezia boudieri ATCC MYA-4762]